MKGINSWSVPEIGYRAGILDWTKLELRNMNHKTRKIMNLCRALHPRANTDWMNVPRKGVKGLLSIIDCQHQKQGYNT